MNKDEVDEVTAQVIILARKGALLPLCPKCNMMLDLDTEAIAGKCNSCEAVFVLENVLWIRTDMIPKA